MNFSLIIATLGRKIELDCLLQSLLYQVDQNFEVIVIDQNPPDFLFDLRYQYQTKFSRIVWLNVDFKAANKARNLGLDYAQGNIVTFVDDDCEYLPNTLKTVAYLFAQYPQIAVLTGKSREKITGRDSMGQWPKHEMDIRVSNVLELSLEFTTFYRHELLLEERLDNQFGPGTRFGSREGPDLMLRLLYRGYSMLYSPTICLLHPQKFTSIIDPIFLQRTESYELGFGALLAKHLCMKQSLGVIIMLTWRVGIHGILGLLKNIFLIRLIKIRFWLLVLAARFAGFYEYILKKHSNR